MLNDIKAGRRSCALLAYLIGYYMGKKSQKACVSLSDNALLTKQIRTYIALTLLISWPFMITSSLANLNAKSFTLVMFAPFIAVIATTYITIKRTGIDNLPSGVKWHFNFKKSYKLYLFAWIVPMLCAFIGALLYYAIFSEDFSFLIMALQAKAFGWDLYPFIARQCAIIATISVLMAAVPAMGEEAGWRGFLMPRLVKKYGQIKALVLGAFVWAVWQWPMLILQSRAIDPLLKLVGGKFDVTSSGYMYGVEYFGAPWTGMIAICLYTFAVGTIAWWLYCKSESVWVSSLFHGTCSAVGMFALEFRNVGTVTNWLLGPSLPGLISLLPLLAIALWLAIFKKDEMVVDFDKENLG